MQQLPIGNRYAFQHMVKLLVFVFFSFFFPSFKNKKLTKDKNDSEVTENEKYTKLNPSTLSVVFAPNVLQDGDPTSNPFDTSTYEAVNTVFKDVRFISSHFFFFQVQATDFFFL